MATQDVVWAMQARANHNARKHPKPMENCYAVCQKAWLILDEDEKSKRNPKNS